MAEALFDEHPLEEYLRESGDCLVPVPGGLNEFSIWDEEPLVVDSTVDLKWLSCLPKRVLEVARVWARSASSVFPTPHSEFAERFKYDVISSALLSSSVSATPLHTHGRRRSLSPSLSLPGKMSALQENDLNHTADSKCDSNPLSFALLFVGFAALWNEYRFLAVCSMIASTFCTNSRNPVAKSNYVVQTLEHLDALMQTGNTWDSVVNEAITILDSDERSMFYGPTTPSSPSSSLRIALHSSLLTTHQQCDNIRQLLTALTSPQELAQLSEMYAPASPMKPTFSLPKHGSSPFTPRDRTMSLLDNVPPDVPSDTDKRSTWNGSYASLAGVDNPSVQKVIRRRNKRRSDMSALLEGRSPTRAPATAPTTPTAMGMAGVSDDYEDPEAAMSISGDMDDVFGSAALKMRQTRRVNGAETMRLIQRRSAPSMRASISSSSSRFTTMQTTRHPLSLSALHHALQGALASKRYACSHLLALRFDEDDDDGYWEDVRSVMALLTTTFEDASSRLAVALDESDMQRKREEQPSPSLEASDDGISRDGSASPILQSPPQSPPLHSSATVKRSARLSPLALASFAPTPNELARFAAHVGAISSALDDAREHLKQCVASLREGHSGSAEPPMSPSPNPGPVESDDEPAAIKAYERLRRELGLALRECERGRGPLSMIFEAQRERPTQEDDDDGLPALGHDTGNGSSGESDDRHDMSPATPHGDNAILLSPPMNTGVLFTPYSDNGDLSEREQDDATSHLLLTSTSQHLPPPGIEQVFESDSAGGPSFTRERSKLTREERIRLTKARRESGHGRGLGLSRLDEDEALPPDVGRESRKGWGPGGEVVQELKDVIWKVGERRRKLRESTPPTESSLSGLRVSFLPETESSTEILDSIRDYDGNLSAT